MRARSVAARIPVLTTLTVCGLALGIAAGGCKKEKQEPAPAAVALDAGAALVADADTSQHLPRPFLWRVEKDGKTSHVFGTMHLGVDAQRSLPPWVWSRLDAARAFAMEADATDPSLLTSIMRSDGTTLQDELGPGYWAKLEQVLTPQMAKGMLGFKASAVAVLVTLQGLPMTSPMDLVLAQRAKGRSLPITYLEEARLQQALVDKWMDVRTLKAMLDDPEAVKVKNGELLTAYRAGDDAALTALVSDQTQWKEMGLSTKDAARAMDEMLFSRNRAWVAPLETLFAGGDAFAAVGVGHLVGDQNVLELLNKRGYTVTRVTGP